MTRSRTFTDIPGCSMEAAVTLIMGKWKGVILFHLLDGTLRFNELTRQMRGIAPRLLTKQLRELEEDGLVQRTVYPVVPPKVEYTLTEEARTLAPLLIELSNWGEQWLKRRGIKTANQLEAESAASKPPKSARTASAVRTGAANTPKRGEAAIKTA